MSFIANAVIDIQHKDVVEGQKERFGLHIIEGFFNSQQLIYCICYAESLEKVTDKMRNLRLILESKDIYLLRKYYYKEWL